MRNGDIVCSACGGLEWGNRVGIAVFIKSFKEKINKWKRQMIKSGRVSCLPKKKKPEPEKALWTTLMD